MVKFIEEKNYLNFVLIIFGIFLIPSIGCAGTYWVSQNGTANWVNCENVNPISGASACSLSTANANVSPGDTVYIRAGTYNTGILPNRSGTSIYARITYEAYDGDGTVVVTNTTYGIFWRDRDYIKVKGIKFDAQNGSIGRVLQLLEGSSYNEIAYCEFYGSGTEDGSKIWDGCARAAGGCGNPNVHNWIHHCTFAFIGGLYGYPSCEDGGGFQLGVPGYDNHSNNNTLENNVWYAGGHHLLETFTRYNVIRNNFFHNEAWLDDPGGCPNYPTSARNGKYGNRNYQIYYEATGSYHTVSDGDYGAYNLVEGNRTSYSSFAIDGKQDGNLTVTSGRNIIRYNDSFYSETFGIYFKSGSGGSARGRGNKVYNNTLYYNGQDSQAYSNDNDDWRYAIGDICGGGICSDNVIKNNLIYGTYNNNDTYFSSSQTYTNNWASTDSDPLFTNTNLSDPMSSTQPDFSLQSGSPAIDKGTHLTLANGSSPNNGQDPGISLVVDDALYFQDGSWGSILAGHQSDWIAIGTVENIVQISTIDYATNTITLKSAKIWSDNDKIWLYKIADGTRVLHGSAPDIGSSEFGSNLEAPKNLRIVQ